MKTAEWTPVELLEVREIAERFLLGIGIDLVDAEELAANASDKVALQDRAAVRDLRGFTQKTAELLASNHRRLASVRLRSRVDVEQVHVAAKGQSKKQRALEATEALGVEIVRTIDAMPQLLDYPPDNLDDSLVALAQRWQAEDTTAAGAEQAWVLFALARAHPQTRKKMAAIARRSFPRDRFNAMRPIDKPPFARTKEELARLLFDYYYTHSGGLRSASSLAHGLASIAAIAWRGSPLVGHDRLALQQAAQDAVSLAKPDPRVQGRDAKRRSETRAVVREAMRAWGFAGTDNLLKRLDS